MMESESEEEERRASSVMASSSSSSALVVSIPPSGEWTLVNVRVPSSLLVVVSGGGSPYVPQRSLIRNHDVDDLVRMDIRVSRGRIVALRRSAFNRLQSKSSPAHEDDKNTLHYSWEWTWQHADRNQVLRGPSEVVYGDGRICLPTLVDMHTHIDKSHTCERNRNADGSLSGADASTGADASLWTIEDVLKRMRFCLTCAYHYGTSAVRTHLISIKREQRELAWRAFSRLRDEWRGRIELQAVALTLLSSFRDKSYGEEVVNLVASHGGVLGAAVCCGEDGGTDADDLTTCGKELPTLLDTVITLAKSRNLDLDFHVDENGNEEARGLMHIALAVLRNKFKGKVVCGHCCSLASQSQAKLEETLKLCRHANIYIVTLPVVNMWLQDRDHKGRRTPKWRGTTVVKEILDANIPIAIASDNIRDQFYAYGDMDLLDIFRQSVTICHLDRPSLGAWPQCITRTPADAMGLSPLSGRIAIGGKADMILFNARCFSELLSRPQGDRVVIRDGCQVFSSIPSHRELDNDYSTKEECNNDLKYSMNGNHKLTYDDGDNDNPTPLLNTSCLGGVVVGVGLSALFTMIRSKFMNGK